MRWGILFRREIVLSYARFQDIHLSSNVVERWLGLARIEIQTASGSAKAEMTIEGLMEFEAIRDFLYTRMRGQRSSVTVGEPSTQGRDASRSLSTDSVEEIAQALRELTGEVRHLRTLIEDERRAPQNPGRTS